MDEVRYRDQLAAAVKSLIDSCRGADSSDQLAASADTEENKDYASLNRARSSILASTAAIKSLVAEPKNLLQDFARQIEILASLRWLAEFQVLACIPFDESLPVEDLADLVGVPESQLVRVIRLTATCGFLREPISGFVSHSALSAQFITNQSLLDATVFIADLATPTALQMPQATQRFGNSSSATDSAYNLALNTVRPFHVAVQERSRLRRQWSAYLCHAAGLHQEEEIVDVLSKLNWSNLGNACIVEVGAKSTSMAGSLSKMFPSLRFVVQIDNTRSYLLDQDYAWQSAVLGGSTQDSSGSGSSPSPTNPFVTVSYRAMGMPQSVTDAAVYIIHIPVASSGLTIKAELDDYLGVLRASGGIMLIMTARLLPEPGSLSNSEAESMARARDLSMLHLANEGEMEISDLLSTIKTVGDSAGKLVVTNHLRSNDGIILALTIKYQAYIIHKPTFDSRSPAFTSDTLPIVGSWNYFTQHKNFWKDCVAESKNGHFSFWIGKNHIIGLSGAAARKMYLDSRDLDPIGGSMLIGHGPDIIDGKSSIIPAIWTTTVTGDRLFAHRRLLDLQKSEQLTKRLARVTKDCRDTFSSMSTNSFGVINPTKSCYPIVVKQYSRIVGADEISNNPKMLEKLQYYMHILQTTSSVHLLAFPWLSYFSVAYWKRRYGRWGFSNIVTPIVNKRMMKGALRVDDALQLLIDNGDSKTYIIDFLISMLFIAGANATVLTGAMLNIIAHHPDWQERIYREIKATAASHSTNKGASLVDQLDSMPLSAWESLSQSLELCFKETIRMWAVFPVSRRNITDHIINIAGTHEVIPPGGYTAYHSTDVHYNENLYPDPMRWDPERFCDGREEFKKEDYGYIGWGQGRHPCIGMRWAKLQQNINIAYPLAMYKWSGCDENGQPNPNFAHKPTVNRGAPTLPMGLYCKYVPRGDT
ncbi:hypothetical protein V492_02775 [Pseudogymnoascus sp. VKM F-4246]|nr:hypothetical protein V492_02775 [Pseudogymnoascus sp. VKM F-4246]